MGIMVYIPYYGVMLYIINRIPSRVTPGEARILRPKLDKITVDDRNPALPIISEYTIIPIV